jgi:hypothetical protein
MVFSFYLDLPHLLDLHFIYAMANVFGIDLGYNVSVKIFASHLFLRTVLLMSARLKQGICFFITNKPTIPYTFQALFSSVKSKKIEYILKRLLLLFTISTENIFSGRLENEVDTPYAALVSLPN